MKHILSFGAGVQSTALLLMSCKGLLPKLDAAVFADVGWEPQKTKKKGKAACGTMNARACAGCNQVQKKCNWVDYRLDTHT